MYRGDPPDGSEHAGVCAVFGNPCTGSGIDGSGGAVLPAAGEDQIRRYGGRGVERMHHVLRGDRIP